MHNDEIYIPSFFTEEEFSEFVSKFKIDYTDIDFTDLKDLIFRIDLILKINLFEWSKLNEYKRAITLLTQIRKISDNFDKLNYYLVDNQEIRNLIIKNLNIGNIEEKVIKNYIKNVIDEISNWKGKNSAETIIKKILGYKNNYVKVDEKIDFYLLNNISILSTNKIINERTDIRISNSIIRGSHHDINEAFAFLERRKDIKEFNEKVTEQEESMHLILDKTYNIRNWISHEETFVSQMKYIDDINFVLNEEKKFVDLYGNDNYILKNHLVKSIDNIFRDDLNFSIDKNKYERATLNILKKLFIL